MQVVVIAFGPWESSYRNGLISARTYKHLNRDLDVYVTVDQQNCPCTIRADLDSFGIHALEFAAKDLHLRSQSFADAMQMIGDCKIGMWPWVLSHVRNEPVLLVDNDTVCIRALDSLAPLAVQAREGGLRASPDVQAYWDNYLDDPASPAYVPPDKRKYYFNSGVILTSPAARDIFDTLLARSETCFFKVYTTGMRGDQPALNYLINMEFPDRLGLLSTEYNSIGGRQNDIARVKIVHWTVSKYSMPYCHENLCNAIIHGHQPKTYEELFPNMVSKERHLPRGL